MVPKNHPKNNKKKIHENIQVQKFSEIKVMTQCFYKNIHVCTIVHCTLSLKSLSGLSSVYYKTTQIAGGMGGNGAVPPTSKLGTFLSRPLALSKPIYSNFQINGTSGKTLKPPDPRFLKQNRGLEVSEFLPKLHLFGNCYISAYLEPRTITKVSPI